MNPYKIDINKLKESEDIKDKKELIKLKLISEFLKKTSKMETAEILSATDLHKSDLSRLKSLNLNRFTIDRIIGLLDDVGLLTSVKVQRKPLDLL